MIICRSPGLVEIINVKKMLGEFPEADCTCRDKVPENNREYFLPTQHVISKVHGEIFRSGLYGCLLFYVSFSNANFVLTFTTFSN